jgi:hypothetical protein
MSLSFKVADGPRQRTHSEIRVPRDSAIYCLDTDSVVTETTRLEIYAM